MILSHLARSLYVATAAAVAACGCGGTAEAARHEVAVQPPTATVQTGGNVSFAAGELVDWSVREGPSGGSVTAAGLYTAPGSTGIFHVVATSRANPSVSGSSTVTVVDGTGEVLAFPGAEGFGARATGGRGGQVIKVTNLNASGPGSLQAALNVNAPRIIVFDVSGVIPANVTVAYGNVTIAGQTAPGGGITIAGRLTGAYSYAVQNIIVRHVRVRPPRCVDPCDADQYDAIQFSRNNNLILDHVSVAYGADETIDVYEADDVTIQWTTIEASQIAPQHSDGSTHNYGIIHGPDGHRISYHHNVCANHSRRCPAIANGPADVRNNVAYNVRHAFLNTNPATGSFNFVGNYFKDGPSAAIYPYYFDDEDGDVTRPSFHTRDSYVEDAAAGVSRSIDNIWLDNYWGTLYVDASHYSAAEFDFRSVVPTYVPITTGGSQDAYGAVLQGAGAFPRDGFTTQTIAQITGGTGAWNPNLPADLMAGLTPTSPPTDADNDGMADAWELAHGLSPANGTDHATVMASGYTAIEEYINELAADVLN